MSARKILGDRRVLFLLVFIIVVYSALYPISMSLTAMTWTQQFYDVVEALPDGAAVYVVGYTASGSIADMSEGMRVVFRHLMAKNCRIVIWDQLDETAIFDEALLEELYGAPVNQNPLYGTHLVYLGYLPGLVNVYEMHKSNLWGYSPVDAYGTPLDQLPLTHEITSVQNDTDLIVGFDARGLESAFVVPFNKTTLMVSVTTATSYFGGIYTAGLFKGMIYGQKGAAEYTLLSGIPSNGMSYAVVLTLITGFCLIMLVILNVYYFVGRTKIRQEKKIGGS